MEKMNFFDKFLIMSFSLLKITPFENSEIANSEEKSLKLELSCDIPSPAYSPIHPKAKQNVINAYPKMSGYRIPMKSKRTDENNEKLGIDSSETKDKAQSLVHELSCEIPSPAYSPIHLKAKQNVVNEFPKISGLEIPMKSKPIDENNENLGVYFDSSGSYTVLPRYKNRIPQKTTNKGQCYDAMGEYKIVPYKKKAKKQRNTQPSQMEFDKFERMQQVDVERMQQVEVDEGNNTVTLRYMEISEKKAQLTIPFDQIGNLPGNGVDQYLSQMRQMCSYPNM